MKGFLLALQFLTVFTVKSDLKAEPRDWGASVAWYGVVGCFLGVVLAIVAWLLAKVLPGLAVAAVVLFLWAALTRFLHLDGVADTADALVYYAGRERALAIMKDTRLGSFGATSLVLVLLLKFSALASMNSAALVVALPVAGSLGRAMAAVLAAMMPAARPEGGLGASTVLGSRLWHGLAAAASAVAAAAIFAQQTGLAAALGALLLGLVLAAWFKARLGGVTGDTLGASIELTEALSLLVMAGLSA